MMKKSIAILLLLGITACQQQTTENQADFVVQAHRVTQIDSLLQHIVQTGQVGGISALIFEKGKEVYFGAYGDADRDKGIPMSRNTLVQIYSMTKPLTGTALMTLYETGAFHLDDPLTKFAPEFENMQVYKGVDQNGNMLLEPVHRDITIRDITRHTAGFPNRPDIPGLGAALTASAPLDRNNTLTEMAEKFGALPLWFQPGSQWEYGPSVDVQAFMVERISGVPYREYLQKHVLDPLEMTDTRYYVPEEDRNRFSAMYFRDSLGTLTQLPDSTAKIEQFQHWPLARGGWGLTSSLDDYMRFAQMLLNRGTSNGKTVLKPETIALMSTNHLPDSVTERSWLPSKGRVGFGIDFAVRVAPAQSADENYGVVGEFFWDGAASTLFWVDPKNELAAVLFVQLFPYDPIKLHKRFKDVVYGQLQSSSSSE